MINFLFAIAFFVGFTVESMIGLGGLLLAYSFLLFFIDIKSLVVGTIILPFFANFIILCSDPKSLIMRVLVPNVLIACFGLPIGIFLFSYLPSWIILKFLSVFLILFGLRNIFIGEIVLGEKLSKFTVFIGGIIHGLVGLGGPVSVIGLKNQLTTKSEVRVTLAVFFMILNCFRIMQLSLSHQVEEFFTYYWCVLPAFIGVILGHFLHKKISESQFKTILSVFFIIAGVLLMFR